MAAQDGVDLYADIEDFGENQEVCQDIVYLYSSKCILYRVSIKLL